MEREVQRMTEKRYCKDKGSRVDVEERWPVLRKQRTVSKKFLGKFLQDDNFKKIGDAVEAGTARRC